MYNAYRVINVFMKFKEVEKMLIENGWYLVYVRGRHYQYKHLYKNGKITIPRHNKDVNIKTLNSILKQAGIKNKESNQ